MKKRNGFQVGHDILIVDDEEDIRKLIAGILQDENYQTRVAGDSSSALRAIENRRPSLLILDIWLRGSPMDGLEILDKVKKDHPDLPTIMISGHGNIETAVSAMKKGAYDFIEKPFKADHLILTVERAVEAYRLKREITELKGRYGEETELVGSSVAISQLRQVIERVAPTGSRVLIEGPAGSGKEVVARLLHVRSGRAKNPFVAINAAAMAPERMEVELFGVEPGPDGQAKVGLFEQAHGGTLYLDEVSEMPLETQSKILRVLVEQRFERVGSGSQVQVDVRVVSSSSKHMSEEIKAGRLREDLYHRLNVVPIRVPSLAERREDIPELVKYLMERLARSAGLPYRQIGKDAITALQTHDWPGNVRELRNNVERLLILSSEDEGEAITAEMLPPEVGASTPSMSSGNPNERIISLSLREAREIFEREYLIAQINRFNGNISRTAEFIRMERSALHRKLKSLGISSSLRSSQAATQDDSAD
jgi:two-component system nitrogen regulation response regulator NtrX